MEKDLQQIADMLLLNGTLTENPGLVHGKMGIAVFFFHYAQYTNNMLFADYSMDVISEMSDQIHVNSPADYEKGLAGIGVGIDYLIQNKFLLTENDICEDFDQRMVRAVMYDPWDDFSLYDGLTGYGRYWISRMRYQAPSVQARKCLLHIVGLIEEQYPEIPVKEQTDVYCFLYDLQHIPGFESCTELLAQCQKWDLMSSDTDICFPRLGNSTIGTMARMAQRMRYFNETLHDGADIAFTQAMDMEKVPTGMGLLNGYAGEGLLRLTALQKTNRSWILLL